MYTGAKITKLMLLLVVCCGFNMQSVTVTATSCSCKNHNANSEADGTCSRTEDDKLCTMRFSATTPEEYRVFRRTLSDLGLKNEPRRALTLSKDIPPEELGPAFIRDMLPILFAISQRDNFAKNIPLIAEIVKVNSETIFSVYADREYQVDKKIMKFGDYSAIISYGCMELKLGNFATMVKTPWSLALFYCDDFLDQEKIGEQLKLYVLVVPESVTRGEKTAITITIRDQNSLPLPNARVSISAGGGKFLEPDESFDPKSYLHSPDTATGLTNLDGSYTTWWVCNPCATGYGMIVEASKNGFSTSSKFNIEIKQ